MVSRITPALLAGFVSLSGCTSPALPALEARLAAEPSATAALGHWCAARRLADPPTVTATSVTDDPAREPSNLRGLLGAGSLALGYRHVRLACGGVVLSEAHNWYVPARLTPGMNARLGDGRTPFGTVAAPLGFSRERLSARRGPVEGCPARTVLSHRALLRLPDGRPLAIVVECYQPGALAAPG